MPASKDDFVAHQHKNEHKLAERNELAKLSKYRTPPAAPDHSMPNLVPTSMPTQTPMPVPMPLPAPAPMASMPTIDFIRSVVNAEQPKSFQPTPNVTVAPSVLTKHKFVVLVERIPWTATKQQVVAFFEGIQIVNGAFGINFIVPDERAKRNDAFVEVATYDDFQRIRRFELKSFANCAIGRNVQGS